MGQAVGRTHRLGVRRCLPDDVGRAVHRWCRGRPARTQTLRPPSGGRAGAAPRTRREPLGSRTHPCLAERVEGTCTATARGTADPEDPLAGAGPARHRPLHAQPRRGSYRRHGIAGDGWQLRNRRTPRRALPGSEGHRARRRDRARNTSRKGGVPRRTDLGRRPGGRICARAYTHSLAHTGHVLSLLPCRSRAATLRRPCGTHRHAADRSPAR